MSLTKPRNFPDRIMRSTNASKSMILKSEAGSRCPIVRKQPASKPDPVLPDRAVR